MWLLGVEPAHPRGANVTAGRPSREDVCDLPKRGNALSSVVSHIVLVLESPIGAAVAGLVFALAFLALSRSSFRLVRPGFETEGMALAAVALFGRLALATVVLWAYKHYLTPGFKPFAFTFAGGFLVLYTAELVRFAGLNKMRRPQAARR